MVSYSVNGFAQSRDSVIYTTDSFDYLKGYEIIGIGEESHGVAEHQEIRTSLVKYTIKQLGSRFVCVEDGFYPMMKLLLKTRNKPFSIKDMRYTSSFNRTHENHDLIQAIYSNDAYLIGVDPSPIIHILGLLKDDFGILEQAQIDKLGSKLLKKLKKYKRLSNIEIEAINILSDSLLNVFQNSDQFNHQLIAFCAFNMKLTASLSDKSGPSDRDYAMYRNTEYVKERLSKHTPLILMQHNAHVCIHNRLSLVRPTGNYLREQYGKGYFSIQQEFGYGDYLGYVAHGGFFRTVVLMLIGRKYRNYKLETVTVPSSDHEFDKMRKDRFTIIYGDSSTFNGMGRFHSIGVNNCEGEGCFQRMNVAKSFDATIWVQKVRATRLVKMD